MPPDPRYDVAIVGLGPVGAFTALLLAERGLDVVVLERSRELVELPRAVGLDGESSRAFQRVGQGDAIQAIVQPHRDGERVLFANSKREPLFGVEFPEVGPNGWRDVAFFDQPELEALLRELVAKEDRIEVRLGHAVVAIEQSESEVVLHGRDAPDAPTSTLRAAFAIGCDGAGSFVREALGIDWLSLGYDQDWLVLDVVQEPEADLPIDTMQICDPERLSTYICVKDPNRRWEFALLPGETREQMLAPETIETLLSPWLPKEHYQMRRAAVYQFHAATAARWQQGRVFLAGDAAHQTPPFLGQGLNAGFRDAVNLAWKIPLVVAGTSDERLLESYAAERDAHARDLVDWAVAIGKLMETLAAREAGLPDPYPATDESSGYGQGRTIPPLRDGVLIEAQLGDASPVGSLLRQPTVRRAGEDPFRLDEALGRGFAVIGREESDLQLGPEARAILERIGTCTLALDGLEVIEGEFDALFLGHPAVVLRPDRIVFGVVDPEWSLDRLVHELGAALALR